MRYVFRRRANGLLAILALVLFTAACGGGGGEQAVGTSAPEEPAAPTTSATTPAATTPAASTPTPTAAAGTPADGAEVATADSDLGQILVDGEGFTLYLFDNDSEGESACTDDCAETWPPLTGEATAGEGADAALLGTITREDGSEQVTYNGHPLYRFAPDEAPGDVNGQGVGEVWWVVSPEGESIKGSVSASGSGAGY